MRSARAFGFATVLLIEDCAEVYAPKVVRSSAGAVFGLTIAPIDRATALNWLETRAIAIIAADARGEENPTRLKSLVTAGPIALALGSEADGLSVDLVQNSRLVCKVGHESAVESLNVAIAGSILMKQVYDAL